MQLLQKIRLELLASTGLTCSIGCAPTYALSKVCSDINKPNNQFIVNSEEYDIFCLNLKLNSFTGIGPVMFQKLESLNIKTFSDALNNLGTLSIALTKSGFENILALLAGLDFIPDTDGDALLRNPCGMFYCLFLRS